MKLRYTPCRIRVLSCEEEDAGTRITWPRFFNAAAATAVAAMDLIPKATAALIKQGNKLSFILK